MLDCRTFGLGVRLSPRCCSPDGVLNHCSGSAWINLFTAANDINYPNELKSDPQTVVIDM